MAQAWEAVKPEKIKKCFRKEGDLDESFRPCEEVDPFEDEDEVDTSEMHNLIGQLGPAEANLLFICDLILENRRYPHNFQNAFYLFIVFYRDRGMD